MKTLAVTIQKGGTGKTTTAAALAQAAAYRGQKVLAVDLDPQGNFSFALAADQSKPGAVEFLQGAPAAQTIQTTPQGIDIIAAGRDLAALTSTKGSARRLQKALQKIQAEYDIAIIDTPTKAGELQYNALQAATQILIPLQADIYNMQSFFQTVDTARAFMESNPGLSIAGILFTRYKSRITIVKQMRATIEQYAASLNIDCLGAIREGIAVQEAAFLQQSLFTYAPKANPSQDYLKVYDALIAQE